MGKVVLETLELRKADSGDSVAVIDSLDAGPQRVHIGPNEFATVAEAVAAVTAYPDLYTQVRIKERANSLWDVVTGETADGYGVIAAGSKQIKLRWSKSMTVEEFGAVTTSADSSEVLNYAMQFVDGKGVTLSQGSDGEFKCLSVVVRSRTTVKGLILKSLVASSSGQYVIGFHPSASYSKIKLCQIDGDKVNQTVLAYGINGNGSGNTVFKNYVHDTKRDAVSVEPGTVNLKVLRNKILNPDGRGVSVKPSSTIVTYSLDVAFNDVENTGSTGMEYIADDGTAASAGVHNSTFRYNVIKNTGLLSIAGGIGGYSPNNRNIICEHNTLENCNNHMHHFGGDGIKILYNKGKGFTNSAIMLRNWPNSMGDGAPLMKNVWVTGNEVEDVSDSAQPGSGYGIQVVNCENVYINSNSIKTTTDHAIIIEGEGLGRTVRCSNIQISGGSVQNSGGHGLAIWKSDSVSVTGGFYDSSAERGIHVQGSTFVNISGAITNNSGAEGVRVSSTSLGSTPLSNVSITGVTSNNNTLHGIYVSNDLDGIRVQFNTMINNTVGAFNNPTGLTNSYVGDNITNSAP